MRSACLPLLLVILLAACGTETPGAGDDNNRPNILLILADDLGNNDLGIFGDGSATTPNIDRLARQGVRFTRHYAHATCRPSRVELLTGMAASRIGVPPHLRGIGPEVATLPEILSEAGYATLHLGKWHLGQDQPSSFPDRQGFTEWFGFLHALETGNGVAGPARSSYYNPWLQGSSLAPRQISGHLTDILTDAAVTRIKQLSAATAPWFINLWYFAPHTPVQPAARFAAKFPETAEGRYLALVAQLDDSVGRLLQALDEAGELADTLVVFASDNGGVNKDRNSNKPYFGKKNTFYEGGLRTPLILSRPGTLAPREVRAPVFIRDLMPSLLAHAGLPVPTGLDGKELTPLLLGGDVQGRETVFWDMASFDWSQRGVLDLAGEYLVYQNKMQRHGEGWAYFASPQVASAKALDPIEAEYASWAESVRRVALTATERGGQRHYTGNSYRRTPGYGAWTLQLPVLVGAAPPVLAQQEGHFSLRIAGRDLELVLPGTRAEFALPGDGCQLLTISTYYQWSVRRPRRSTGHLAVRLGERVLHSASFPLNKTQLVDNYPAFKLDSPAGEPVISNAFLSADITGHYQRALGSAANCGQ